MLSVVIANESPSLKQLFVDCEIAARENEILGEEGVKKAALKKQQTKGSLDGYK